jgi:hypothetical protein
MAALCPCAAGAVKSTEGARRNQNGSGIGAPRARAAGRGRGSSPSCDPSGSATAGRELALAARIQQQALPDEKRIEREPGPEQRLGIHEARKGVK